MSADLEITGALLVTPDGERRGTLVVEDGRISGIAEEPSGRAKETIDADGLVALPGMVDQHVHFMEPGPTEREDFAHGSTAAAVAGVTCVAEHTHFWPVRTAAQLQEKIGLLEGRSVVDFVLGAHASPDTVGATGELREAGAAFVKAFTCTTHGNQGLDAARQLELLRGAADAGIRVLAHCEDESLTSTAERDLRAALRDDYGVLPLWRSPEAELVAVAVTTLLARLTGARVTIAHASQPDVIELVERERARGARLDVETCPQYLTLDEDEVVAHGPARKFTPPARPAPTAERMWELVDAGAVGLLSSDHAPATLAQKHEGDIWDCPFGLPGIDTTMPLMLDGVARGKLSFARLVQMYSANPAAALGLAGRKGALAPGADADIVLVDLSGRRVLADADVHSKARWTPYAGREVRGRVAMTFVGGTLVARDGEPLAGPGTGRFLTPSFA
jgi:dihydroorotase (multifunctional complex type)